MSELYFSPYIGVDDVRWTALEYSMFFGSTKFEELQGAILTQLYQFDITERDNTYQVPVMLISGSADWTCPCGMVLDYFETIEAPRKSMYVMEGCGHSPMTQLPDDLISSVKQFLKSA